MPEPVALALGFAIGKLLLRWSDLNDTAEALEDTRASFTALRALLSSKTTDPVSVAITELLEQQLAGVHDPAREDEMRIAVLNVADVFAHLTDSDIVAAAQHPSGFAGYLTVGPGGQVLATTSEALTPFTRQLMGAGANVFAKLAPRSERFSAGALLRILDRVDTATTDVVGLHDDLAAARAELVSTMDRVSERVEDLHRKTDQILDSSRYSARVEVSWPVRVGKLPALAKAFQPRSTTRQRIDAAWSSPHATSGDGGAGDSPAPVVALTQTIVGDGGVGKSQLAASIAQDALRHGADLVVWVPAGSRDQVVAAYADAARRVHAPGAGSPDSAAAAAAFLDWVATTPRPWLVVLDDLDLTAGQLHGLWPDSAPGTGRVLITTRQRGTAVPGLRVELNVFTPLESHSYLHQRVSDHPEPTAPGVLEKGDELAHDLGHLPVALAQAIAVILDQGITTEAYREHFADRSRTLAELFPVDAAADEYAKAVATTWSLAIEQAATISPLARTMATLVALLDPAGAPEDLFTNEAVCNYLSAPGGSEISGSSAPEPQPAEPAGNDGSDAVSPEDARASLRALHRLSIISHDPSDSHTAVRIHALAQRAITDTMTPDQLDGAVWAVADALYEVWPESGHYPAMGAVLRANTFRLHEMYPDPLWDPGPDGRHSVLFQAVASLGETGQVAAATEETKRLLEQALQVLGPDHPNTLVTRGNLAYWRLHAGDPTGAAAAFRELLPDQLRVLGPDHPLTLGTRGNFAGALGEAGDPAGAAVALKELLADQLRVLGPDHPSTLATRGNLADHRGEAGDPAGAAVALEELLPDQLRVLGPDHPVTLGTRGNLAGWRGWADPTGAAAATEALLTDYLRVLGPDHPSTLTVRNSVADWRGRAGDPTGAVAAFRELLPDQLRVLGPDHPGTMNTRNNLAGALGEAGDPTGAAVAFRALLPDQVRVLGPDHPDTFRTRNNLAGVLGKAGDLAGEAATLEQLLADQLRVLGPDHPNTLGTRNNLAGARGRGGDPAGAAAATEAVLTDYLRVLGSDHPNTLNTRNNLAGWRGEAGDAAGAAAATEAVLTDHLHVLGPDHPNTLATRNNLAGWRGEAGDAAGAAAAYEALLTDQMRVLGPDHPNTLNTRNKLASWRRRGNGSRTR